LNWSISRNWTQMWSGSWVGQSLPFQIANLRCTKLHVKCIIIATRSWEGSWPTIIL
jgi:hypothetical protein